MNYLRYSQNYFRDPHLVRNLITHSSITKEDVVLEIGSGKGIITTTLAEQAGHVHAIEKDTALIASLKRQFVPQNNVTVHHEDFLDYELPKTPYKVFSNIPFMITADILRKLLNAHNPPSDSYLVVQQEAAPKYTGQPYGNETLTSLLYKPWFIFSIVHAFKPADFEPTPRVNSVLLRIEKRISALVNDHQAKLFKDFVTYGFTRNRPTIKKAYEHVFGHVQFLRLANDLNFSIDAKPTDPTFEQWLGMFNYFTTGVTRERRGYVEGATKRLAHTQKNIEKVHRSRIN